MSKKNNDILFEDANSYYCYEGDLVYYVCLSEAGTYSVSWTFAEEVKKKWEMWTLLIEIGFVKSVHKNKEKAQEVCDDANIGVRMKIDKIFISELLK
jgi:hypothetical protein